MLQLVLGNGGVELNKKAYLGCVQYSQADNQNFSADVQGMSHFGFAVANLEQQTPTTLSGWKINNIALGKSKDKDKWGKFESVQVCQYPPALKSNMACEITNKDFFPKQCPLPCITVDADLVSKCADKKDGDDDKE